MQVGPIVSVCISEEWQVKGLARPCTVAGPRACKTSNRTLKYCSAALLLLVSMHVAVCKCNYSTAGAVKRTTTKVVGQRVESMWQVHPMFVFARRQRKTDGLAAICYCMFWLRVLPQMSISLDSIWHNVRLHFLTWLKSSRHDLSQVSSLQSKYMLRPEFN